MNSDQDARRSRAVQAGLLMRSYREAHVSEDGRRGLSQDELLRRMAEVEGEYPQRMNHAAVSRWEAGSTRHTVERFRTFGAAVDLPEPDVAGLILLAGLAPDFQTASLLASGGREATLPSSPDDVAPILGPAGPEAPAGRAAWHPWADALRDSGVFWARRCLPLGVCFVALGYALSLLGWNGTWMPLTYTYLAAGLVLGQWFLFPDRCAPMRELYWVSIFMVLSTPLLQFAPLGLDHYNIYRAGDIQGTHLPWMLALLANLGLSSVAGFLFNMLWRWQYRSSRSWEGALRRCAAVTLPPSVLVYGTVLVTTNAAVAVQLLVVIVVTNAVTGLLLVLWEPDVNLSEGDRRFLFPAAAAALIVSVALGVLVILGIYFAPNLPGVLPDHNLFSSWELDFDALGYSREEALSMVNSGYLWNAIWLMAYMVLVLGGGLLTAIYRSGGDGGPKEESALIPPEVSVSAASRSSSRRSTRTLGIFPAPGAAGLLRRLWLPVHPGAPPG